MLSRWRRSPQAGFTIIEAIMAIAVIAILAAIVVPVFASVKDTARVVGSVRVLRALAFSDTFFLANVTKYPGRVSHLGSQIASTDTSSCSGILPSNAAVTYGANNTKWPNNGPYYFRAVSKAGGLPIGIGVINDQMLRTSNNTTAGTLDLVIPAVRLEDADDLNDLVDGTAEANNADLSNTLGIVRWTAPTAGILVDVRYRVNVSNKC